METKTREERLEDADSVYGQLLPSYHDKKLESVCRLIYDYTQCTTDELWAREWRGFNDAHASKMGGTHSLLTQGYRIISLLEK